MVSKITLFEPHFDGAQFGPASMEHESDSEPTESDVETGNAEGARGRSAGRVAFVLGALAAGVLVGLAAIRRGRRTDSESVTVEERPVDELAAE